MRQFKKGQWVWWNDPEDITSGLYRVLDPGEISEEAAEAEEDDRIILIGNLAGSEAHVFPYELVSPRLQVIFRIEEDEVSPAVFALFPGENPDGSRGTVLYYESGHLHHKGSFNGCIKASVPTREEDYAPLLAELKEAGFDQLQIITYHEWRRSRIEGFASQLAHLKIVEEHQMYHDDLCMEDGQICLMFRDEYQKLCDQCREELSLLADFEEEVER